jgi:hypothetical protein
VQTLAIVEIHDTLLHRSPAWVASDRVRRRRAPLSAAVRRSVPVRTFSDWKDPPPGYFEADLVAHSGPVARGSFVQTLVLTDTATGWTECAPLLVRGQVLLVAAVVDELRRVLPFELLGYDTDNDTAFMNETLRDYRAATGLEITRCRPYCKNDQAFVEQKNGAKGPDAPEDAGTVPDRPRQRRRMDDRVGAVWHSAIAAQPPEEPRRGGVCLGRRLAPEGKRAEVQQGPGTGGQAGQQTA